MTVMFDGRHGTEFAKRLPKLPKRKSVKAGARALIRLLEQHPEVLARAALLVNKDALSTRRKASACGGCLLGLACIVFDNPVRYPAFYGTTLYDEFAREFAKAAGNETGDYGTCYRVSDGQGVPGVLKVLRKMVQA